MVDRDKRGMERREVEGDEVLRDRAKSWTRCHGLRGRRVRSAVKN